MFDIRDAEIVQEIVRAGGFRAAAARLNLTQSAVSARVSGAEARLGIVIFDRARRGAQLTAKGRAFLDQAERLLAMRNRIVAGLAHEAGYAGTIRIGVSETIVHTWLAGMLTRLRGVLPEMRLELSVETSPVLGAQLVDGDLDVAVMMRALVPARALRVPIYRSPVEWFAAADYAAGGEPLGIEALAAHPIITFSRGTLPYCELEAKLSMSEAPPLFHACASLSTTLHLTRAGIGLLPSPMAADDRAAGRLRRVATEPEAAMSDLTFDFAHLPEQPPSLVVALCDAARAAIAEAGERSD